MQSDSNPDQVDAEKFWEQVNLGIVYRGILRGGYNSQSFLVGWGFADYWCTLLKLQYILCCELMFII